MGVVGCTETGPTHVYVTVSVIWPGQMIIYATYCTPRFMIYCIFGGMHRSLFNSGEICLYLKCI